MTHETRLQRILERAQRALEARPEPSRPGLDLDEFTSTRRAAFASALCPTLVHPIGGRRLSDLVDPSTAELLASLQALGAELERGGVFEVLQRVQARGVERRSRLLGN